jgi:hypothetical protein
MKIQFKFERQTAFGPQFSFPTHDCADERARNRNFVGEIAVQEPSAS